MPNAFERAAQARGLQATRQRLEVARRRSYDSMRRVLAIRKHGGAITASDPHEVVSFEIDRDGAPVDIHIEPGWEHHYSPEELSAAVAGVARKVELDRSKRAQEYLDQHPEALSDISDHEIEQAFARANAAGPALGDSPAEVIGAANDFVPEAREIAQRTMAGVTDELQQRKPARVVLLAGVLVAVVLEPQFVYDASTTRINAALATALADALDAESSTVNPAERSNAQAMRDASTQAHAAATAIITALRAMQLQAKETSA